MFIHLKFNIRILILRADLLRQRYVLLIIIVFEYDIWIVIKSLLDDRSLRSAITKKYLSLFLRIIELKLNQVLKVNSISMPNAKISKLFRFSKIIIIFPRSIQQQSLNTAIFLSKIYNPHRSSWFIWIL